MSRPYATDENLQEPTSPQPRGAAARGATSSMKNILYGGDDSAPTPAAREGGGKRAGYQNSSAGPAPFATTANPSSPTGPARNQKPGDTGNKFAVGADKIGETGGGFDASVYAANQRQAQDIANAARARNLSGGGGIFG